MIVDAYLDDFQVHRTDAYALSSVGGLGSPEPRRETYPRPRRHGAIDLTTLYDGRVLELVGRVYGDTMLELHTNLDELKKAFALGSEKTFRFRRDGFGEDEEAVTVRVASALEAPMAGSRKVLPYSVTLFAADPRIYATTEKSASYDPTSAASAERGVTFPLVFPLMFAGEASSFLTVENQGNFPTPPSFTITGPALLPEIVNDTTGESIVTAGLELLAGEELVVNVHARTVTLGGAERPDLIDAAATSWFDLIAGENQLRLEGDDFAAGQTELAVTFQDARI